MSKPKRQRLVRREGTGAEGLPVKGNLEDRQAAQYELGCIFTTD